MEVDFLTRWGGTSLNIIHLSDLHIGKSNNLEKSSRLVGWILDNPDLHRSRIVAVTGDLVDDGFRWQFLQARSELDRLHQAGYCLLVAPGNHDYGPDGYRESKQSMEDFREIISGVEEYPQVHFQEGLALIILDTMEAEIAAVEPWGAQGYLGQEQLLKLDRILDELSLNPDVEKVVVIQHHHPFDYLFYHGLRDHEDLKGVLVRRLESPPRVNALLFGHKHRECRFNDPEDSKELLYGIDLIYASGQTVERNAEGKMTLPVIDLEDMTIHRFFIP